YKEQVAIITGAASGLGLAIAQRLSAEGVKIAHLDFNEKGLLAVASKLPSKSIPYVVDITDEVAVKATIEKVKADFGSVHILINSAGITGQTNIKSHLTDTADIRKVFEVNYYGSYYTSKYVIPIMLEQNYGRILHIASIAGKEGNAGM